MERRRSLLAMSAQRARTEENAYAYARVGSTLYYSTDCGKTWTSRGNSITSAGGLAINANGDGLATGGTSIWDFPIAGGYNSRTCTGTPQNICQSSGSEYIYYSTNAGSSWQTGYSTTIYRKAGLAGSPVAMKTISTWDQSSNDIVCSADGKIVLLGGKEGYSNSAFYSTDYGATWVETAATQSAGAGCNQVDMSNDGKYCIVGTTDGMWFSSNGPSNLARTGSSNIRACAISGDGNVMYYSVLGSTYRSLDKGGTWSRLNLITFAKICASYHGQSAIAVGVSSDKIYYTTDYGENWESVSVSATDAVLNKFY